MLPTAVAKKLIDPIEEGLARLSQAIDQTRDFVPRSSNQLFRIAINDIGQLVFMPRLLAVARTVAPQVRFETFERQSAEFCQYGCGKYIAQAAHVALVKRQRAFPREAGRAVQRRLVIGIGL